MKHTVIVVDDDDVILFLSKKIIEKAQFNDKPYSFNSAQKALDFINDNQEIDPILIFLDINMPVMDGWDLLDILHESDFNKEVKVVMVTSSIDAEDRRKASSYKKVIDFVEKPFNTEVLNKLKQIL